jgi:UDP-N-acetylglucosamine 2-epimerase (non-hydrolysing)/GDP/UDP-N,N'-diacetylbacillosamine 2-epimerase (hydrolysing)
MKKLKRKVCFITGTRADYGHLYWIMREVQQDLDLELQVIVTGAHLCERWGNTIDVIAADKFPINAKVHMQLSSDGGLATCKSMALAVLGLSEAYDRLAPDIIVLLGDRYEELAAAQSALLMRIPVAHIHGGETSEGAMDESIRHAVTKLAHIHFVAASSYKDRVLQLGEDPGCVFNYGAPGLEHLTRAPLASKEELADFLKLNFEILPTFLITIHPATLGGSGENLLMVNSLLGALNSFPNANLVFTGVNTDPGNAMIQSKVQLFVDEHPERARLFGSLGQKRYLGLMRMADVVIGNSSSGLIEAPALKIPTVNIGDRQNGRLKAPSVIDCSTEIASISAAIELALSKNFIERVEKSISLYGNGKDTSFLIKEKLKTLDLSRIIVKKFHDLPLGI